MSMIEVRAHFVICSPGEDLGGEVQLHKPIIGVGFYSLNNSNFSLYSQMRLACIECALMFATYDERKVSKANNSVDPLFFYQGLGATTV